MRKGGILHPVLSRILSETGHTDTLTICDRGFPVPQGPERLDLALVDDIPTALDVLRAIAAEFVIDKLIVTKEMQSFSPERFDWITREFGEEKLLIVSHLQFKEICPDSRAVIRTGDSTPYANMMIISG